MQFRDAGWRVRDQPCHHPTLGAGANVVATLDGDDRRTLVVVGAHHDTVAGSPGADDNGSGLAALVELARILGGRRWHANIELAAFDFEERDADVRVHVGSCDYVAALSTDVAIRGAFIYDLIAYTDRTAGSQRIAAETSRLFPAVFRALEERGSVGDFVLALTYADDRGKTLLRSFIEGAHAAKPDLSVFPLQIPPGASVPHSDRSDHVSFWEAGHPAIFLTDTANFRNPHYHQATDTVDTLDAHFWSMVVSATAAAVATLAEENTV
jgi:Zn-dependent M28 family amino/carboxypeptidase